MVYMDAQLFFSANREIMRRLDMLGVFGVVISISVLTNEVLLG